MREKAILLLASLVLLAALLPVAITLAQGEPLLNWQVIAGGGGPSSDGSSVAINDTLGQPVVGPSSDGGSVALGAGYWYGTGAPTAVTLASFSATSQGQAILLAWETASEIDLLGFHLYRAESAGGELVRLNEVLIPGQLPGSSMGTAYEFVDESVVPGATYWYWLEDVDVHGAATRHGPVSATVQAGERYPFYLPLVNK